MIAERPAADQAMEAHPRSSDRSMLVLQYGLAAVAALAAFLLAGLH